MKRDVKAGLGFVRTNVRICWNPVYKAFHRICSVEMYQLFGSNSNVILKRQTCGHGSSRVAESKRRALPFYFSVQIWCVFLMSKCRGELDLGLCMTSVRAKRMRLRNADFRRVLRPNTFSNRKLALCSRILFARTEVMCRPRSDSPLHFDMGWLWLVGSIKSWVSFAKESYKRDNILQKRPIILSILPTVATPYEEHIPNSYGRIKR